MEKTWFGTFLKGWKKSFGTKPTMEHCADVTFLGHVARKRPGYELWGAVLASRPEGMTMQQYLDNTGAAGPCANTVGNNGMNPFKRHGLMIADQTRGPNGKALYRLTMTPKALKLLAERDAPAAEPVAKKAPKKAKAVAKKVKKVEPAGEVHPDGEAAEDLKKVLDSVRIGPTKKPAVKPAKKAKAKVKAVEKPLEQVLAESLIDAVAEAAAEKQELPPPPAEITVELPVETPAAEKQEAAE